MSGMLSEGTGSIRGYKFLVKKMKFPVSTIPTFVSLSKLYAHLAGVSVILAVFWAFGYPPDIYILQLPLYILCMFVFFTILSLFTSIISAMSKDFGKLMNSLVSAAFWLSGVIYDVNTVKIPWLKKALMFNPITFICNGYRNCFVYKIWFFEQSKRFGYFIIVTVIMFILAILAYRKFRKEIPDVL